ncbi:MAG: hypothetical protein WA162_02230 [Thermodesulfobacteriota bacterium]
MNANLKIIIATSLTAIALCGCGGKNRDEKVSSVNGAPILKKELETELTLVSIRDPGARITGRFVKERLDMLIEKNLLIQEAMKTGLSEDKEFAETVKAFWEQTLIRELIRRKSAELEKTIFVTDDEIRNEFEMEQKDMPVITFARAAEKNEAEVLIKDIASGKKTSAFETLGPLGYDEYSDGVFKDAFTMRSNDAKIVEYDGEYIVFSIVKKVKPAPSDFKASYAGIKSMLLEKKKKKTIEDWIKKLRDSSDIEINDKALKGLQHGA